MKICIINNLYEPFNKGGAETITKIINNTLVKNKHKTTIITTKPYTSKITNTKQNNKIYINSIFYNIDKIPLFFRLPWHIIDTFNIKNYLKLKNIFKKEKFDIVITNNLKGIGLLTPLAIKKTNIKHIHILHDIQLIHPSGLIIFGKEKKIDTFLSKIYQKITIKLFSNINLIISPSQWLMDIHTNKMFFKNSKTKIIENPVLLIKNINTNYKKDNKIFNFLYIGQIENHKGIIFLMDTFKKYLQTNKNVKLTIIGDGTLKSKIKLNQNIEYLGKKNNTEVQQIMQKTDCLIVPSLCYENSPTVIYEGLNANIKIIASDIGGISEIIKKTQNTFLFKPNNYKDLIKKMNIAKKTKIFQNNFNYLNKLTAEKYIEKLLSDN